MKKIISILLSVVLILSFIQSAFAIGDTNVDSGGGGMGQGTGSDYWSNLDGVRVTVVKINTKSTMRTPLDYTNFNIGNGTFNFGKKSKLDYVNGGNLTVTSSYVCNNPRVSLPTVISTSHSTIAEIKKYFSSEGAATMIAEDIGISFETLTNGEYKLLIEPIAYIVFGGQNFAMTAHEAALYDKMLSGGLRAKFVSLSHKNLPLAMFLERDDLGFSKYTGSTSTPQSNDTILRYLGIGTVTYVEKPIEPVKSNIEYRTNTEVITSVYLSSNSEINPDNSASVIFNILNRSYEVNNIVIPEGESQVVWVKWTTPNEEQTIEISVTSSNGSLDTDIIVADIVDLDKNPPPDPKANDRNDNFTKVAIPTNTQKTSASWSVWDAYWQPYWVWISVWNWCDHSYTDDEGNWVDDGHYVDNGYWKDLGWWVFYTDNYNASLSANSTITPDEKNPTAIGNTIKSGYGVNNEIVSNVGTSAPNSHTTVAQTGISYFSEFDYTTFWRLLDITSKSNSSSTLEFKVNGYSGYGKRTHFTPVWYPDGEYEVYTYLRDCWTPVGELSINLDGSVNIEGSVFDDWHFGPK